MKTRLHQNMKLLLLLTSHRVTHQSTSTMEVCLPFVQWLLKIIDTQKIIFMFLWVSREDVPISLASKCQHIRTPQREYSFDNTLHDCSPFPIRTNQLLLAVSFVRSEEINIFTLSMVSIPLHHHSVDVEYPRVAQQLFQINPYLIYNPFYITFPSNTPRVVLSSVAVNMKQLIFRTHTVFRVERNFNWDKICDATSTDE